MEMEWESEFSEYTELEWEISIPFNTDVDPRVYVAVRWVPVTITWENGWSEKGDMYGFRIYEVELISGGTDDIVFNLIQYCTFHAASCGRPLLSNEFVVEPFCKGWWFLCAVSVRISLSLCV